MQGTTPSEKRKKNMITVKVYDRNNSDYLGTCVMAKWQEYEKQTEGKEGFVVASEWLSGDELADINCQDDAVVYFEEIVKTSTE
jgi:hypothetical protein